MGADVEHVEVDGLRRRLRDGGAGECESREHGERQESHGSPRVDCWTSVQDVASAWRTLSEKDGLVPYLDYATPEFYDQITAAIQEMLAGRDDPQGFTKKVQDDYAKFANTVT